jgi:predicted nuclease of predicted toxin-antitoxin system
MNLPPAWVDFFRPYGIDAEHWSSVGAAAATDREIALWAQANACVLLTHDLDLGLSWPRPRRKGPA